MLTSSDGVTVWWQLAVLVPVMCLTGEQDEPQGKNANVGKVATVHREVNTLKGFTIQTLREYPDASSLKPRGSHV